MYREDEGADLDRVAQPLLQHETAELSAAVVVGGVGEVVSEWSEFRAMRLGSGGFQAGYCGKSPSDREIFGKCGPEAWIISKIGIGHSGTLNFQG